LIVAAFSNFFDLVLNAKERHGDTGIPEVFIGYKMLLRLSENPYAHS